MKIDDLPIIYRGENMILKGTFVRISHQLLSSKARIDTVPIDTKNVPLEMWVKGRLLDEAKMFEQVCVITTIGRKVCGILKEQNPRYKHSFGDYVEEITIMKESIINEYWQEDSYE